MSLPEIHFPVVTDEMHAWLLNNRALLTTSSYATCAWCGHSWHGSPCASCHCATARERLDDTWRPMLSSTHADQVRKICHQTGADGWTARACVGITTALTIPSPERLKRLLYGKGTDE